MSLQQVVTHLHHAIKEQDFSLLITKSLQKLPEVMREECGGTFRWLSGTPALHWRFLGDVYQALKLLSA